MRLDSWLQEGFLLRQRTKKKHVPAIGCVSNIVADLCTLLSLSTYDTLFAIAVVNLLHLQVIQCSYELLLSWPAHRIPVTSETLHASNDTGFDADLTRRLSQVPVTSTCCYRIPCRPIFKLSSLGIIPRGIRTSAASDLHFFHRTTGPLRHDLVVS